MTEDTTDTLFPAADSLLGKAMAAMADRDPAYARKVEWNDQGHVLNPDDREWAASTRSGARRR